MYRGKRRSCCLGPWLFWSKLGIPPFNRRCNDGTHDSEVNSLEIKDRGVANDPHDSRRKDKIITSRHVFIDIYERENEV